MCAKCGCAVQGSTLSYGELDERANQLAHHLIALGVGPEVPVGVMMERSLDMFVALLGVLKAGGAYVPMDPGYPPDRLALMMEDSEVGGDCVPRPRAAFPQTKAHALTCSCRCAGARAPQPEEGARAGRRSHRSALCAGALPGP